MYRGGYSLWTAVCYNKKDYGLGIMVGWLSWKDWNGMLGGHDYVAMCYAMVERMHLRYMVLIAWVSSFRNVFPALVGSGVFAGSQQTGVNGMFCPTTVTARCVCNS